MRVILHADDLGISARVNEAIFALMEEGRLTSASILANGPAFAEAARCVPCFPKCSFGVHLNITEFAPLLSSNIQPLLTSEGRFQRSQQGVVWSAGLRRAIQSEWAEQIRRVRDAGVDVSHIDSHHHTHTGLALFPCLEKLCRDQKVHRVRIRQTFAAGTVGSQWRIDNRFYNWRLRRSFYCADEFGAFAAFGQTRIDPQATVEIMVHPGNPRYEPETEAFRQSADELFRQRHECITYRDLN